MPKVVYRSVVIPAELHLKIKRHIENSRGRYVSISEFVREAVWKFLHEAK